MKNHNVAMFVSCNENPKNIGLSNIESIKLIKKAGFRKIGLFWQNDGWGERQEEMYCWAKKLKLEIVFAHLGFRKSRAVEKLWLEGSEGNEVLNNFIQDLNTLKQHGITTAVMHVNKSKPVDVRGFLGGISRWKQLIDCAEKLGITIAVENTTNKGDIEYLFECIDSDHLKVCYDSGHDHIYFEGEFDWSKFKNKIVATHLHDNDKKADEHLLPFDGNIDWDKTIENLKMVGYNSPLMSESIYKYGYPLSKPIKFFKEAYRRLCVLERKLNKD